MPVWLLVIVPQSAPHPASCPDYPAINAVENADTNAGRRICAFRRSRPFRTYTYRTPFPSDCSEPGAANSWTMCSSGIPMIWNENSKNSGSITMLIAYTLHSTATRHQKPPAAMLTSTSSSANRFAAGHIKLPVGA
jgi:hypothetical protein